MLLFESGERTNDRPGRYGEPEFSYIDQAARPAMAAFRQMANEWFSRLSDSEKADVRGRFQSEGYQHSSAFWELYLHELLTRTGYSLKPHPQRSEVKSRPDFLVSDARAPLFYLEATLGGVPSVSDAGGAARKNQVYNAINSLKSPDFFLELRIRGAPATPPSGARLRRDLTKWLGSLDFPTIDALFKANTLDEIPRYEWSHEGWNILFRPIPKSPKSRGQPRTRPIGMMVPEARYLATHVDLREALENKSKKYGKLDLPYVVAVNMFAMHCDLIDIMNALFGQETCVVFESAGGKLDSRPGERKRNGFWFGPRGARNSEVSGVVVTVNLSPVDYGGDRAGVVSQSLGDQKA